MNLPDTYAGGQFGLPIRVAKLVRLAESTDSESERESCRTKLWKLGYFLDRVDIIWAVAETPDIAKDDFYNKQLGM